jgi:hypothetical protein
MSRKKKVGRPFLVRTSWASIHAGLCWVYRKGGVSVASGRQGAMMMVMMQLMMMMAGGTSAAEGDSAIYSRVELSHFSLDRFNLHAERSLQYPGTLETTQYRLAKNNRSARNGPDSRTPQRRRVAGPAATVSRCPRSCVRLQGRRRSSGHFGVSVRVLCCSGPCMRCIN